MAATKPQPVLHNVIIKLLKHISNNAHCHNTTSNGMSTQNHSHNIHYLQQLPINRTTKKAAVSRGFRYLISYRAPSRKITTTSSYNTLVGF